MDVIATFALGSFVTVGGGSEEFRPALKGLQGYAMRGDL